MSAKDRPNAESSESRFVADGAERLAEGIRQSVLPTVQKEVEAEYAKRLDEAGWLARLWIRWQMQSEIEHRVEEEVGKQMPSGDVMY